VSSAAAKNIGSDEGTAMCFLHGGLRLGAALFAYFFLLERKSESPRKGETKA